MPSNSNPAIDSLRDEDGSISRESIKKIIPYDVPFFFVDKVVRLEQAEIESQFYISPDMAFIPSHFVGFPVMPAVLILEGFGQAGTILTRYSLEDHLDKEILIYKVEEARFKAPAFPGDTLIHKVRIKNMNNRAARLEGETLVGEKKISSCRIVLTIQDKKAFRENSGK
jgi:3-hydroxyacyl-[acyl-carrier-protein] dehydratase